MEIPDDLVALVRERRLIPFVGAGFSAGVGLPDWEALLRDVASQIEGAAGFDEILRETNGDLLQVAEYLLLKCDRHIGPIRHAVERGLGAEVDATRSGVHVELANLNAQQIYTTNYDDLIEDAFRRLGVPVTTVVLPKDVALADTKKTQIVKYHGDLRHESTLVLTESAYYNRLDFESPMDLKFRSDLLGRSVLFMGYSFRDINIRIIWYKLMQMMKDIPEADRTPSYIVRAQHNPILEELYRAVGLRSIVLSDSTKPLGSAEVTRLYGAFLMQLADRAEPRGAGRTFLSFARIESMRRHLDDFDKRFGKQFFSHGGPIPGVRAQHIIGTKVPPSLVEDARELVGRLLDNFLSMQEVGLALKAMEEYGPMPQVTGFIARVIAAGGHREPRHNLLKLEVDWPAVWSQTISKEVAADLIERLRGEVTFHLSEGMDEDIAYAADVVKRIASGQIYELEDEVRARAVEVLAEASAIYPEIETYDPPSEGPPNPLDVLAAIARKSSEGPAHVRPRRPRASRNP